MHLFLTQQYRKVSEQKLDTTEMLEPLVLPLEEAVEMVLSNEICVNSTAHGILKAARLLGK